MPLMYEFGIMLMQAPVSMMKSSGVAPSRAATSSSGELVGALSARPASLNQVCEMVKKVSSLEGLYKHLC